MRSVAVIGVAGPVGQSLVRRLAADPSVERLVGVDDRDPEIRSRRLEFHRLDAVKADLSPVLTGVDSVAHVDLQGDRAGDGAPVLESARRVLDASAAAGIGTLVYTSSATVYGAWPTNPVPLTEDAPTRPNPGFAYAIAQAEAERLAADWRDGRAGVSLAVLRPVTVLGPGVDGWLARLFRDPPPVRVSDARPPVQYVHTDDVAAAVELALRHRLDGVFNVAPDGWMSGDEARALTAGRFRVAVPEPLARRVTGLAWALGLGRTPAEVVPYLVHPWVVANDRLRAEGWEPQHTSEDAFVIGAGVPPWQSLSLGRRQAVGVGVAAAAVAAGVGGAVAIARRRRRP
jgi:nucleoside-diphosphate-sugar epimerase